MARTVQARLDDAAEDALSMLRNEGRSDSEAVRVALHEAADRRRRRSSLRAEAEALAGDPADRAEAAKLRAEMDSIATPWPDE